MPGGNRYAWDEQPDLRSAAALFRGHATRGSGGLRPDRGAGDRASGQRHDGPHILADGAIKKIYLVAAT